MFSFSAWKSEECDNEENFAFVEMRLRFYYIVRFYGRNSLRK